MSIEVDLRERTREDQRVCQSGQHGVSSNFSVTLDPTDLYHVGRVRVRRIGPRSLARLEKVQRQRENDDLAKAAGSEAS